MSNPYSKSFFAWQEGASGRSAEIVVPLVMELLRPKSVVDVGCGVGTWLSVFQAHGAEILGVDGSYVDPDDLHISRNCFRAHDLTKPLRWSRTFDLVVSLEVAEHLSAAAATTFVNTLTELGPVVLFSAAIPYQGGTHHVNEQWPEYWMELFEQRGYQVIDCLRRRIWNNPDVAACYAQNILLYARPAAIEANPALKQARAMTQQSQLALVHPLTLIDQCDPDRIGIGRFIRRLAVWVPVFIRRVPSTIRTRLVCAASHWRGSHPRPSPR